jgi:hypothetical protein
VLMDAQPASLDLVMIAPGMPVGISNCICFGPRYMD